MHIESAGKALMRALWFCALLTVGTSAFLIGAWVYNMAQATALGDHPQESDHAQQVTP